MADAPTIGSVLAAVVPVVVGGVMALVGGAGMQWYLHRDKTAEERRVRKRDKFESLVLALYEYDHWLDERSRKSVWGEEREPGLSPYAKMQAIAAIYFPQFTNSFGELRQVSFVYERWMMAAGLKRLKFVRSPPGTKDLPNITEGFDEVYRPYRDKRDAILDELRAFASRELN